MADADPTRLVAKIRALFPDAPPPHSPAVVCKCDECAGVEADFHGKRWSEVGMRTLENHYTALPLLSAEAFRYYLPAFMLGAITDPESSLPEFTMYNLLPDGNRRETCEFSVEQERLIVEFAHWLAWSPESERIEAYWSKPAKS